MYLDINLMMLSTHQHILGIPGVLARGLQPPVVEGEADNISLSGLGENDGKERERGRYKMGKTKKKGFKRFGVCKKFNK